MNHSSKYFNKKTTLNGILFDSRREAQRYAELKLLLQAGEISDLELQVPFVLQPAFRQNGKAVRAITYKADFVYRKDGQKIVEDVKNPYLRKHDPKYAIKKKMMMYVHGIEIKEV